MNKVCLAAALAILHLAPCPARQTEKSNPSAAAPKSLQVFQTAKDFPDRLAEKPSLEFGSIPADVYLDNRLPSILIDADKRYQTIEGFGGAFTESAAVTFYKLSPEKRAQVLRAYFDPVRGNGYTLCRTHINSCDFSTGNYAYDETPGDTDLRHFSIERDKKALIPLIHEAMKAAGRPIKLFASPWSPPAWMKTNGEMNHGGRLKPECREAWARYFCKFVHAYVNEGVPVWGITVQNEPEATQTWDSCIFTPEEERDFIRDFLGPSLEKENLSNVRLIAYDHNRNRIFEWAKTVLDDPAAARYVWGVGFHWYSGDNFDNVRTVQDAYPDKKLLFTEGCLGPFEFQKLDDWKAGETYARSMIQDLNRWTVGWVDWNILLDERGGPNHVGNYCFAPIHADLRNDSLVFMNSYYYIGHFSRFIQPGAVRIACAPTRDELEATAFLNPDGTVALVVMNRTGDTVPFAVRFNGHAAKTESPGHSIQTYIIKKNDQ
jgi:glucosylceramidase